MHLTIEQLDKALAYVNQQYKIDGGHFEIAREKYHKQTLQFFKEVFWADEPIYLDWDEDCADFHMKIIKENLTLIIINDKTDEIMGMRMISQAKKDEILDPNIFHNENVTKLFTFMNYLNENGDFFNHYGVTEAFEFVALAVDTKYRKQGLGGKLMAGAVCFLRQMGLSNCYIKSLGTSKYSQAIFDKIGFESIYRMEYKDYIVEGEVVFNSVGLHKTVAMYVLKL